jgi:hypothetical protein
MSVPPNGGWPQAPGPGSGQQGPANPSPYAQQPYPGPAGPWPPAPGYPPPVPPQKGNGLKWVLGGVVLLLVIGLAVTTTLLLRGGGGGGVNTPATPGSSSAPSDIASANDTGPLSIIVVEPTCDAYYAINNMVADAQDKGWGNDHRSLGPVSQWTSDQRASVQQTSDAMSSAADQLVPLAKRTPHRLVRELYEQLIAYSRAYVAALPTYTPHDNDLADATVNAAVTITSLCNAITYGSAPLVTGVDPVAGPTTRQPPGDVANPKQFITAADATCQDWVHRQDKFAADTEAWKEIPSSKPGAEWTPDELAINEAAFPIMSAYADANEKAGRASGNPILEDFAVASSIYLRALVEVGKNYQAADGWLGAASLRLASFVSNACTALGTK